MNVLIGVVIHSAGYALFYWLGRRRGYRRGYDEASSSWNAVLHRTIQRTQYAMFGSNLAPPHEKDRVDG